MEISSVLQMTRTRLRGLGQAEARALPSSMLTPVTVLTTPSAVSPPARDRSMAGSAA